MIHDPILEYMIRRQVELALIDKLRPEEKVELKYITDTLMDFDLRKELTPDEIQAVTTTLERLKSHANGNRC